MKQYFFRSVSVMALLLMANAGFSQSDRNADKVDENKQIIIQQKSDKNSKVTVEIKDGEVKVNGKPLSEFKDDDITVRIETEGGARAYVRSPFRSGGNAITLRGGDNVLFDSNRPMLGVMTENHEDGAKITSVTKGSGAEKAGLKSGDIINRINDIKVENAQDLTEAVAKFKPEEKVTVRIKRDNKTETVTATLGKRSAGATNLFPSGEFNENFRYHFDDLNGVTAFGPNQGRLGIKAQDTEDEKGVKVLSVDADSHAAKSGIKEGDIIHQFDGEEVNSATELAAAARQARDKNNIKLRISRDGKSQDMEIKIPKKLRTANL
jgi:serine protease Do